MMIAAKQRLEELATILDPMQLESQAKTYEQGKTDLDWALEGWAVANMRIKELILLYTPPCPDSGEVELEAPPNKATLFCDACGKNMGVSFLSYTVSARGVRGESKR